MRNIDKILLTLAAASATACAGRAHTFNPQMASTKPTVYACDNQRGIVKSDKGVRAVHTDVILTQGWRDDEGSHFIAWPTAATTRETVSYFIPDNPLMDATESVYDTTGGTSRADWKLLRAGTCTASGGYNDALARYAGGKSFDQVARDLHVDQRDARELVRQALVSLNRRYYGKN